MIRKRFLPLIFILACACAAGAQTKKAEPFGTVQKNRLPGSASFKIDMPGSGDPGLRAWYDQELIKIDLDANKGLGLTYKGTTVSASTGLPPDFMKLLATYPESAAALDSYSRRMKTGNTLVYGGLGLALAGAATALTATFVLDTARETEETDPSALIFVGAVTGLSLSGLVLELIGIDILNKGIRNLMQTVDIFNGRRMSEYPAMPGSGTATISPGSTATP